MSTELIDATRLRPGDLLYAGPGSPLPIVDVHQVAGAIQIRSHSKRFSVPRRTRFLRIGQSRRINMRPDLTPVIARRPPPPAWKTVKQREREQAFRQRQREEVVECPRCGETFTPHGLAVHQGRMGHFPGTPS